MLPAFDVSTEQINKRTRRARLCHCIGEQRANNGWVTVLCMNEMVCKIWHRRLSVIVFVRLGLFAGVLFCDNTVQLAAFIVSLRVYVLDIVYISGLSAEQNCVPRQASKISQSAVEQIN